MVATALGALGGIGRVVHKGDYVAIKPNAAFANPSAWGTTTDPETVVAVAKACLAAGAKRVTVVEYPQARGKKCLDRCGLTKALEKVPEVQLKVLSGPEDFKTVKVKGGIALKTVDVAKVVLSADVLINVPTAKAHNETGVSFGIKNAMGLIRDRKIFHTQLDLHQAIADLARVINPQLTVLDATRALLTNGPAGPGETSNPGKIVAGFNTARFNQKKMTPKEVRHIALAAAAGLGQIDVSKLRIKKLRA
jgi:uncharacterized protein (DUF362 family)